MTYREVVSVAGRRSPKWSLALSAVVGAWIAHFVEYVRVSGWQAALGEMHRSAHAYFFPAGAALMAIITVAVLLAGRTWKLLGERLRAAQVGLWKRPAQAVAGGVNATAEPGSLFGFWIVLFLLQTGTWTIQENLETVSTGGHAPLLGVLTGVHSLAPLIQAEIALILAAVNWLFHRRFATRWSRLAKFEQLVAQKWTPHLGLIPVHGRMRRIASTPFDRWGAQRWQRPPPAAVVLV
ncbi:MAG TPA: hypothetical protein VFV02_09225 [Acidimicrobiales bacterium]|nr:hypothetical protein [Acidimicrobiales bacterium]